MRTSRLVLGIFTNAYLPLVSGVVNSIELIREGLEALGHSVCIVAPNYPGYHDSSEKIFRYPSLRLTRTVDYPIPIPFSPGISSALRKIPFDVIHAQHPFLLGNLGAKLAQEKQIPLVFTFHTQYEQYVHYAPWGIPRFILQARIERMVAAFLKKCDSVVLPSGSTARLIEKYGTAKRTDLIPNAISLSGFEQADGRKIRRKYGLEGKFALVFLGRLAPEKNLEFLIRAFSKVVERIADARLLLVGDGPSLTSLQHLVSRLSLEDKVIFAGRISYDQVPDTLAACDLFVMTSTTEVKPLALLEAMAAGLPIVAVKAHGASDTIVAGVTGFLTSEDEGQFAEAVVALAKNREQRNRFAEAAKQKAQEFSSATLAKRLEALYQDLRHG